MPLICSYLATLLANVDFSHEYQPSNISVLSESGKRRMILSKAIKHINRYCHGQRGFSDCQRKALNRRPKTLQLHHCENILLSLCFFFIDCIFILPAESLKIKQFQPLGTSVSWQPSHSWKERLLQNYLNTQVHSCIVCFSFCLFFLGIFPFTKKFLNYLTCILCACVEKVWVCRVSNYLLNKNPIKCKFLKKYHSSAFLFTCLLPVWIQGGQNLSCLENKESDVLHFTGYLLQNETLPYNQHQKQELNILQQHSLLNAGNSSEGTGN